MGKTQRLAAEAKKAGAKKPTIEKTEHPKGKSHGQQPKPKQDPAHFEIEFVPGEAKKEKKATKKHKQTQPSQQGAPSVPPVVARARQLAKQRDAARKAKDWARADALRDEIHGLGLKVSAKHSLARRRGVCKRCCTTVREPMRRLSTEVLRSTSGCSCSS